MASTTSLLRVQSTDNMHANAVDKQKIQEARMRNNAYHLESKAPLPKDLTNMNSDLAEFRDVNLAAKANKKVIRSSRIAIKNLSATKRSPLNKSIDLSSSNK